MRRLLAALFSVAALSLTAAPAVSADSTGNLASACGQAGDGQLMGSTFSFVAQGTQSNPTQNSIATTLLSLICLG